MLKNCFPVDPNAPKRWFLGNRGQLPLPAPVSAVAFLCCIAICYIIYIFIMCIRSDMFQFQIGFLSLSLVILFVSFSISPVNRRTFDRTVPPCKPGPAQGFFLLKGSFSLPLCLPRGNGGFWLCKAPTDNVIVKSTIQKNLNLKLNWSFTLKQLKNVFFFPV